METLSSNQLKDKLPIDNRQEFIELLNELDKDSVERIIAAESEEGEPITRESPFNAIHMKYKDFQFHFEDSFNAVLHLQGVDQWYIE